MASLAKRRDTLVADVQFCRFLLPVPWSAIQRPLGLPQPLMGTDLLAKSGKRPALSKLANLSDHDCRTGKIDTAKPRKTHNRPDVFPAVNQEKAAIRTAHSQEKRRK